MLDIDARDFPILAKLIEQNILDVQFIKGGNSVTITTFPEDGAYPTIELSKNELYQLAGDLITLARYVN